VTIYIDSSALVPVYVPERFSRAARMVVRAASQVPFTVVHQVEVANAFELLVGRGLITRDECRGVQAHLHEDVDAGRLVPVSIELEGVFAKAGEFSRLYTASFLTRSLDLLHVAAAHMLRCNRFASADGRQLDVARASGLQAIDIRKRVRPHKS
jgi:predicted nucleic acid-binding protein